MLNKLSKLDTNILELIRHVRVSGDPLLVHSEDDDVYYRTAQVLKLLPGLNRHILTVLATRTAQISYETLDMLVRYGDGLKELRYISHSSEFLGHNIEYKDDWLDFDPFHNRYLHQPQPCNWQHIMENRDGHTSKPSILIYRSKSVATPNAMLHAERRVIYSQTLSPGQDAASYGKTEDAALMNSGELEKEMMVVVRRGRGIDHL